MNLMKLVVKVMGEEVVIGEVNPDEYSIVCFISDLVEELAKFKVTKLDQVSILGKIPWLNVTKIIKTDSELVDLLMEYRRRGLYDVFIEVQGTTSTIPDPTLNEVGIPQTQPQIQEHEVFHSSDSEPHDPSEDEYSSEDEYVEEFDVEGEEIHFHHESVSMEGDAKEIEVLEESETYEDDAYDPRLDGYKSGDDLELEEAELACPRTNPHSKIHSACRGKPYTQGLGEINLSEGVTFVDVDKFREVLREYRVRNGFMLQQEHNDRKRFRARCKVDGCPWRIVASAVMGGPTFMIRKYVGNHTCERKNKNNQANSRWIAQKFGDEIRANPDMTIQTLGQFIRRQFQIEVPNLTLYRAKRIALYGLKKQHAEEFGKLRSYINEVVRRNPGSMAVIKKVTPNQGEPSLFQRMFVSFGAQKEGFLKGCRPFIGVDGCHLKGRFRGVLLSAVSVDCNSGLFPLAFAVVEQENKHSWTWFFHHLKVLVGEGGDLGWTIMTDRQKGILSALGIIFPRANIRYCARHILANLKTEIKEGTIPRGLYWAAVRASCVGDFTKAMERIERLNPRVTAYLKDIPIEHWARHAFDVSAKADHVTNNMTETWNSTLGIIRGQAIIMMWEGIRRKVMTTLARRKVEYQRVTDFLPPVVRTTLDEALQKARNLIRHGAGDGEWEIVGDVRNYIANLEKNTCNCGQWEVSGIPCAHAIKCLDLDRGDLATNLVHLSLRTSALKSTYSSLIRPVPDQSLWEDIETEPLLPPIVKKQAGKPAVARRKEQGSPVNPRKRGSLRCGICKGLGHNKKSCKLKKHLKSKDGAPTPRPSAAGGWNI